MTDTSGTEKNIPGLIMPLTTQQFIKNGKELFDTKKKLDEASAMATAYRHRFEQMSELASILLKCQDNAHILMIDGKSAQEDWVSIRIGIINDLQDIADLRLDQGKPWHEKNGKIPMQDLIMDQTGRNEAPMEKPPVVKPKWETEFFHDQYEGNVYLRHMRCDWEYFTKETMGLSDSIEIAHRHFQECGK